MQHKTRARLTPEKVGKLTFVRHEILGEIARENQSEFNLTDQLLTVDALEKLQDIHDHNTVERIEAYDREMYEVEHIEE